MLPVGLKMYIVLFFEMPTFRSARYLYLCVFQYNDDVPYKKTKRMFTNFLKFCCKNGSTKPQIPILFIRFFIMLCDTSIYRQLS